MDKTAVLFDAQEKYTTCQLVQVLSNLVTYIKVHIRKSYNTWIINEMEQATWDGFAMYCPIVTFIKPFNSRVTGGMWS